MKKDAPSLSAPSSPGPGSVCVGDDLADTGSSLEAPRRPRSEAQIATFEKARAKRAANLSASAPGGVAEPAPEPAPEPALEPEPAFAPEPAPAPAKRKAPRADKGKKRGYLVRAEEAGGEAPYSNFFIV